jgi:hypothetical protein
VREDFNQATDWPELSSRLGITLGFELWTSPFFVPVTAKMGINHLLDRVLYGMLHDDGNGIAWNAFDRR